jgi:hypothetical protein
MVSMCTSAHGWKVKSMSKIEDSEWTAHLKSVSRRMNRLMPLIFPEVHSAGEGHASFSSRHYGAWSIEVRFSFLFPHGEGKMSHYFPIDGTNHLTWQESCEWTYHASAYRRLLNVDVLPEAAKSCVSAGRIHEDFSRIPPILTRLEPLFFRDTVAWLLGFSELERLEDGLIDPCLATARRKRRKRANP